MIYQFKSWLKINFNKISENRLEKWASIWSWWIHFCQIIIEMLWKLIKLFRICFIQREVLQKTHIRTNNNNPKKQVSRMQIGANDQCSNSVVSQCHLRFNSHSLASLTPIYWTLNHRCNKINDCHILFLSSNHLSKSVDRIFVY